MKLKQKWQDAVFTVGSIVFIVSLVPVLLWGGYIPLSTSIPTGIVLAAYTATMLNLKLTYGALTTGITSIMWFLIAVFRS